MHLVSTGVVSARIILKPHFGGMAYNLEIQTWPRFLTMHLATKLHHPMFNRLEVIKLTNKQQTNPQTNKQRDSAEMKTSTSLCYATPVENYGGFPMKTWWVILKRIQTVLV